MWLEALGQTDLRQGDALQTVGLLTALAVEVRVLVVVVLMVVAVAELVARAVAAALDDVHEMMFAEERQSAEHVRLVDRADPLLQLRHRLGEHRRGEGLHHHDAVGGGLDAVLFKQSHTLFLFHGCKSNNPL